MHTLSRRKPSAWRRIGPHLLAVIALILPFELAHLLQADQVRIEADVVESRIVELVRARGTPFVLVEFRYVVEGREHRGTILTLEPADGRLNWRPEERLAAERYVFEHGAGASVGLWVPRSFPGAGAALAHGPNPPEPQPRSVFYLVYLGLLTCYLGGVFVWLATGQRKMDSSTVGS